MPGLTDLLRNPRRLRQFAETPGNYPAALEYANQDQAQGRVGRRPASRASSSTKEPGKLDTGEYIDQVELPDGSVVRPATESGKLVKAPGKSNLYLDPATGEPYHADPSQATGLRSAWNTARQVKRDGKVYATISGVGEREIGADPAAAADAAKAEAKRAAENRRLALAREKRPYNIDRVTGEPVPLQTDEQWAAIKQAKIAKLDESARVKRLKDQADVIDLEADRVTLNAPKPAKEDEEAFNAAEAALMPHAAGQDLEQVAKKYATEPATDETSQQAKSAAENYLAYKDKVKPARDAEKKVKELKLRAIDIKEQIINPQKWKEGKTASIAGLPDDDLVAEAKAQADIITEQEGQAVGTLDQITQGRNKIVKDLNDFTAARQRQASVGLSAEELQAADHTQAQMEQSLAEYDDWHSEAKAEADASLKAAADRRDVLKVASTEIEARTAKQKESTAASKAKMEVMVKAKPLYKDWAGGASGLYVEDWRTEEETPRFKQEAAKAGLSMPDAKEALQTYRQLDWSNQRRDPKTANEIHEDARLLPNGEITVNPTHLLDPEAYNAAADATQTTPEAKARAKAMRAELAVPVAEEAYKNLRKNSDFAAWLDANTTGTPLQRMEKFNAEMKSGGALNASLMKFLGSAASLPSGWLGTIAGLTGSDKALEYARYWQDRSQAYGTAAGEAGKGTNMAGRFMASVAGGVPSVMESMAVGGVAGRLIGSGVAALGVAAVDAAAQSGGGTFVDAVDAYIAQGLSPEEAKAKAAAPALASGLATGVLTAIGGGGVESLLRIEGRELAKAAIKRGLKTMVAREVIEGVGEEALEEFSDQLLQGIIAQASYNPNKSLDQIMSEAIEAGLVGGVLGGGASGIRALGKGTPTTIEGETGTEVINTDLGNVPNGAELIYDATGKLTGWKAQGPAMPVQPRPAGPAPAPTAATISTEERPSISKTGLKKAAFERMAALREKRDGKFTLDKDGNSQQETIGAILTPSEEKTLKLLEDTIDSGDDADVEALAEAFGYTLKETIVVDNKPAPPPPATAQNIADQIAKFNPTGATPLPQSVTATAKRTGRTPEAVARQAASGVVKLAQGQSIESLDIEEQEALGFVNKNGKIVAADNKVTPLVYDYKGKPIIRNAAAEWLTDEAQEELAGMVKLTEAERKAQIDAEEAAAKAKPAKKKAGQAAPAKAESTPQGSEVVITGGSLPPNTGANPVPASTPAAATTTTPTNEQKPQSTVSQEPPVRQDVPKPRDVSVLPEQPATPTQQAPTGPAPAAGGPKPKHDIGKGAVIFAEVYRSDGRGEYTLDGDPVWDATQKEWMYPATTPGGRSINVAERFVTKVISTPAAAPAPTPATAQTASQPAAEEPALTPTQADQMARAQADHEKRKATIQKMENDPEIRAKKLYAENMKFAAIKRQITGKLTGKEQEAKAKREASNYEGKAVSVDGKNATVVGTAFGKVKVKFEDGTTSSVAADKINAPAEAGAEAKQPTALDHPAIKPHMQPKHQARVQALEAQGVQVVTVETEEDAAKVLGVPLKRKGNRGVTAMVNGKPVVIFIAKNFAGKKDGSAVITEELHHAAALVVLQQNPELLNEALAEVGGLNGGTAIYSKWDSLTPLGKLIEAAAAYASGKWNPDASSPVKKLVDAIMDAISKAFGLDSAQAKTATAKAIRSLADSADALLDNQPTKKEPAQASQKEASQPAPAAKRPEQMPPEGRAEAAFKAGDFVRANGKGPVFKVESIGEDGWVYLANGQGSYSAEDAAKILVQSTEDAAKKEAVKGGWPWADKGEAQPPPAPSTPQRRMETALNEYEFSVRQTLVGTPTKATKDLAGRKLDLAKRLRARLKAMTGAVEYDVYAKELREKSGELEVKPVGRKGSILFINPEKLIDRLTAKHKTTEAAREAMDVFILHEFIHKAAIGNMDSAKIIGLYNLLTPAAKAASKALYLSDSGLTDFWQDDKEFAAAHEWFAQLVEARLRGKISNQAEIEASKDPAFRDKLMALLKDFVAQLRDIAKLVTDKTQAARIEAEADAVQAIVADMAAKAGLELGRAEGGQAEDADTRYAKSVTALAERLIAQAQEWMDAGTNAGTRAMDTKWEQNAIKRFYADSGAARSILGDTRKGEMATAKIGLAKARSFQQIIDVANKLIAAVSPAKPAPPAGPEVARQADSSAGAEVTTPQRDAVDEELAKAFDGLAAPPRRSATPEDAEYIAAAALKDPRTGKIFKGATHGYANPRDRSQLNLGLADDSQEYIGYVTNTGRWVSQEEAENRWGVYGSESSAAYWANPLIHDAAVGRGYKGDRFIDPITETEYQQELKRRQDSEAAHSKNSILRTPPASTQPVEQVALPKERREAMLKAAGNIVDLGLTEPTDLAARLDKLAPNGSLRKYARSFWRLMTGFNADLQESPDWQAVFDSIDVATQSVEDAVADANVTPPQAAAIAKEEAMPEPAKQAAPFDPVAAKGQKKYLLTEVAAAVKAAPRRADLAQEARDSMNAMDDDLKRWDQIQDIIKKDRATEALREEMGQIQTRVPKLAQQLKELVGTVSIEVPGDGTFTILNEKEALYRFQKKADKFPTTQIRDDMPAKPTAQTPTAVPAIKKPKATSDMVAAIYPMVSTDTTRDTLTTVKGDGTNLWATNGRILVRVEQENGGGKGADNVSYDEKGNAQPWPVEKGNYNGEAIIPDDRKVPVHTIDTGRWFSLMSQARAVIKVLPSDKSQSSYTNAVSIYQNPDGSLGAFTSDAERGDYVHNIQPNAKFLASYDPEYVQTILRVARNLGNEQIELRIADDISPATLRTSNATFVIMPMRANGAAAYSPKAQAARPSPPVTTQTSPAAQAPAEAPEAAQPAQAPAEGGQGQGAAESVAPVVPPAKRTKKTIAKIEDVGEKIGGARKDRWKERGLAMSDYDGLTDTEKQAYTNKAQVFPKPDYQALIDGGIDKPMAYALKEVYDSIAPKPNLNRAQQADPAQRDAALRLYVETVGKIRDGLKSVKTPEELNTLRNAVFTSSPTGYGGRSEYTAAAKASMHLTSTGKRSYELPGAMELSGYDMRNLARKLEKLPAWPSPQEQWQRMFDIRQVPVGSINSKLLPDGTWDEETTTKDSPPVWEVTKDYRILSEHSTQEAAEAWAKAAAVKARKEDPKRPYNPDVKRTGEDYRKGRDVTGPELLAEFGFRGAEFGLWTNENDRQQSLNQAFDGLHDLARILNVSPKALSLNGELGIAFGARGSGKAAAHYEPSRVVINLTKTSGAGALAHEWAHGMDDYFGRMATGGQIGKYVSHGAKGTDDFRAELAATINEVMKAISERQWTAPEYIADLKERNATAQKKTDSWLKSVERSTAKVELTPSQKDEVDTYTSQLRGQRMPEALVNGRPDMTQVAVKMLNIIANAAKAQKIRVDWPVTGGGKINDLAAGLGRHSGMIFASNNDLARAEAGDLQVPNRTVPTNTLKASQEQGDYWQRKHELFARSFEAFVEDSIRREGNQSPYLVGFTADSGAWGNLYPQGDERTATNEAFQKMVDAIKTRETDKGVALYNPPSPALALPPQSQASVGQAVNEAFVKKVQDSVEAGRPVGTSNPTTASKTGEGTDSGHNVELDRLRKNNPLAYRQNALILTRYPVVAKKYRALHSALAKADAPVIAAKEEVKKAKAALAAAQKGIKDRVALLRGMKASQVRASLVNEFIVANLTARAVKAKDVAHANLAKANAKAAKAADYQSKAISEILDSNAIPEDVAAQIYEDYITAVQSNLLALIELFPKRLRDVARLWYDGANIIAQKFGKQYNATLEQASAVLAVFSPQKDWFMNVSLAQRMMNIWENDQETVWSPEMTKQFIMRSGEPQPVESIKKGDTEPTISTRESLITDANPEGIVYQHGAIKKVDDDGNTYWENWDNQKAAENLKDAQRMLKDLEGKALRQIKDRKLKARFIRILSEVRDSSAYPIVTPDGRMPGTMQVNNDKVTLSKVAWGGYNTIEKAISIMERSVTIKGRIITDEHEVISIALGDQHKVRSFYNNIVDPANKSGHVTMDTHAIAAIHWMPHSGSSLEVTQNFGGGGVKNDGIAGIKGTYAANAEAYRRAAVVFKLLPREVQSITWEAVRLLFPKEFKTKGNIDKVRAIWNKYLHGDIDIETARAEIFTLATTSKDFPQGKDIAGSIKDGKGLGDTAWAAAMGVGIDHPGGRGGSDDSGTLPKRGGPRRPDSGGGGGQSRGDGGGRNPAAMVRPTPILRRGRVGKPSLSLPPGQASPETAAWKTVDGRTWLTEAEAKGTGLMYYNIEPDEAGLNDQVTDEERRNLQRGKVFDIDAITLALPPGQPAVTAGQDAEYLAAVEAGDLAKAQRIVDEAAKAADVTYVAKVPVERIIRSSLPGVNRPLSDGVAAPIILERTGRDGEKLALVDGYHRLDGMIDKGETIVTAIILNNKDSLALEDNSSSEIERVQSEHKGESADPVTRDESGQVIPLSQRFNPASPSILRNPPAPEGGPAANVPTQSKRNMRKQLLNRGYTKEQIYKMKPAEAHAILNPPTEASQPEAEEAGQTDADMEAFIAEQQAIAEEEEAVRLALLNDPANIEGMAKAGKMDVRNKSLIFQNPAARRFYQAVQAATTQLGMGYKLNNEELRAWAKKQFESDPDGSYQWALENAYENAPLSLEDQALMYQVMESMFEENGPFIDRPSLPNDKAALAVYIDAFRSDKGRELQFGVDRVETPQQRWNRALEHITGPDLKQRHAWAAAPSASSKAKKIADLEERLATAQDREKRDIEAALKEAEKIKTREDVLEEVTRENKKILDGILKNMGNVTRDDISHTPTERVAMHSAILDLPAVKAGLEAYKGKDNDGYNIMRLAFRGFSDEHIANALNLNQDDVGQFIQDATNAIIRPAVAEQVKAGSGFGGLIKAGFARLKKAVGLGLPPRLAGQVALDKEYMDAVEAGDMAKAQAMVDEAASSAAYGETVFHGTAAKEAFTVFKDYLPNFFTTSEEYATGYTGKGGGKGRVLKLFFKSSKPLDTRTPLGRKVFNEEFLPWVRAKGWQKDRFGEGAELLENELVDFTKADLLFPFLKHLQRSGDTRFDSYLVDERFGDYPPSLVPINPNQIKSADPVTRDESGQVIPLSQRFNPASDSILRLPPKAIEAQAALIKGTRQTVGDVTAEVNRVMAYALQSAKARNSGKLMSKVVMTPGGQRVRVFVPFDPDDMANYYAFAREYTAAKASAFDKVYEYWINWPLLSGPQTQVANITGNAAQVAWHYTGQRLAEATLNLAYQDPNSAQFREFKHVLKGFWQGIGPAYDMARQTFLTEGDTIRHKYLGEPLEIDVVDGDLDKVGNIRASVGGKLGRINRLPGRVLRFTDAFFKTAIMYAEASAVAYRRAHVAAKAQGLKGQARAAFIDTEIANTINDTSSAVWADVMKTAEDLLFQGNNSATEFVDTVLGGYKGIKDLEKLLAEAEAKGDTDAVAELEKRIRSRKFVGSLMRWIFPFQRTPTNIIRTGIKKAGGSAISLLYGLTRAGWLAMGKDGVPMIKSYSKAAQIKDASETLLAWLGWLALASMFEGDDDDDKKKVLLVGSRPHGRLERQFTNQFLEKYGGENSVVWQDGNGKVIKSLPFGRYEPIATTLSTWIDAYRNYQEVKRLKSQGENASYTTYMLSSFASSLEDKSFLQGLANTMQFWRDVEERKENADENYWTKLLLTSVMPNLIKQPMKQMDDVIRDRNTASPGYAALPNPEMTPKLPAFAAQAKIGTTGEKLVKDNLGFKPLRILFPANVQVTPRPDSLVYRANKLHPTKKWAPSPLQRDDYNADPPGKAKPVPITDPAKKRQFAELYGKYYTQEVSAVIARLGPTDRANPPASLLEAAKDARARAGKKARAVAHAMGLHKPTSTP